MGSLKNLRTLNTLVLCGKLAGARSDTCLQLQLERTKLFCIKRTKMESSKKRHRSVKMELTNSDN